MLAARISSETNPRYKHNLEIVAQHVIAEVDGDLDALFATLVDEPIYRFWGMETPITLRGSSEVRAFYEESIRVGKNRLTFDLDRVVVDSDHVITEGVFTHAYQGRGLPGRTLDGEPLAPDAWYLVHYQSLVVWPIDPSGLIAGEDIYLGQPHVIDRVLADDEMPHLGLVSRFAK